MRTRVVVVKRENLGRVWPMVEAGLEDYRKKSPHEVAPSEELFWWMASPDGDELAVVTRDRRYAGFLTFKVQEIEKERWGTFSIIWFKPEYQFGEVLKEATIELEEVLRARGCTVMNYLTKRAGFRKLAPKLGFKERIIEYMKEL